MKIKAKIDRMVNVGNVKAIASVSLDGMFVVKNLKVMDGKKGLFVSMPQETYSGKDGQKKYSIRKESAPGYSIYESWKSDVISSWMVAVDELGAIPLVLDARTFISKVVNTTMPQIDYVINLCNGLKDIPVLGAVPAVCAFDALPCIPNNAKTIMIGEDKRISNHLATLSGINIPRETSIESDNGIIRPISFGSSIGVMKTPVPRPTYDYICQEFIEGYDVTVPIMYNPLYEDFEVLPGVLYLPCHADPEWFLGEEEKQLHTAYEKVGIEIPVSIQKNLLSLAKLFQVDTYCRVDTRIRTSEILSRDRIPSFSFELKDLYFLEINTMPTIKEGINFHTSIVNMGTRNRMSAAFDLFKEHVKNPSITGFILASSILALSSKATH